MIGIVTDLGYAIQFEDYLCKFKWGKDNYFFNFNKAHC